MLAAKDQIRRHGPFRRLRRALIRQPQRILSRVRRVFVSLAPAIAPSRVRFAARFKKPLARAPEIEITRSRRRRRRTFESTISRATERLRRVRVASASPSVLSSSPRRARSFASRAFVRSRPRRSFVRASRSIARPSAAGARARTIDARSIARAPRRAFAASRGRRARSSVSRMALGFVTRVAVGSMRKQSDDDDGARRDRAPTRRATAHARARAGRAPDARANPRPYAATRGDARRAETTPRR